MDLISLDKGSHKEITELFVSSFSAAEGMEEGKLIGNLVAALSRKIDGEKRICFGAFEESTLVGCIFFTRLRFTVPVRVYMLSPVAVATEQQGKGVGQSLIRFGMDEMRKRSVAVVVTYGDPAFYSRVGFEPLSENTIQAPLELSMPMGWQGQSLIGEPIAAIAGRPTCAEEFNDPVYW